MFWGILLAFATGLCWSLFGIILSFAAKGGRDIISYSLLQNGLCGLWVFLLFCNFDAISSEGVIVLLLSTIIGGCFNAFGQFFANRAMLSGNHAIVWAITQAAMVFSFGVAVLIFDKPCTLVQTIGVMLILGGILIPNLKIKSGNYNWLWIALLGFLFFGISQSLYAMTSFLNVIDSGDVRPCLVACGNVLGWIIVAKCENHKISFKQGMPKLAFLMSFTSVISLKLFFHALDYLNKANLGSIALPLMIGITVVLFAIYNFFVRGERSRKSLIVIGIFMVGLILLAIA